MHHRDPALDVDHLAGDMQRCSGAGRRIVELARIGAQELDQLVGRIGWKRLLSGEDER